MPSELQGLQGRGWTQRTQQVTPLQRLLEAQVSSEAGGGPTYGHNAHDGPTYRHW